MRDVAFDLPFPTRCRDMPQELDRLARWYREQCNRDWEHQNGVRLVTIDNPGWSLDVNLADTSIAGRTVEPTRIERADDNWVFYEAKGDLFRGRCGPENLTEMLAHFLAFVGASGT